ncbi:NFX1-type zinc finger-containing protein 1, partial [Halocaridina rubra]
MRLNRWLLLNINPGDLRKDMRTEEQPNLQSQKPSNCSQNQLSEAHKHEVTNSNQLSEAHQQEVTDVNQLSAHQQKVRNGNQLSEARKQKVNDVDQEEGLYVEEYRDVKEYIAQEEKERLLDDDDYIDDHVGMSINVDYEITDRHLLNGIIHAEAALGKGNLGAYFTINILSGQRDALRLGLELPAYDYVAQGLEKRPYLDVLRLDFPSRWQLYKYWCSQLADLILNKLNHLESKYIQKSRAYSEIKNQEILYLMRNAAVVGMTTTGAAQYSSVMQDLSPSIVIIEEAAEILEPHVITSLTSNCEHLIMIGDHQQLRPSATVYELATKYGLETSLFERMIKNGLAYETLEYQHRMRPSISKMLVPSVYPALKDHPCVEEFPSIRGITKNVFFINHDNPEREESDDNNSHENLYEAELIMGLCRHLILQGYSPEEVTILTPYSGQFFLLRKLQHQHCVCQEVRICVVDNFQGEENNIILLSLVRSNVEGKVGFLRTDNRVCVALSRAKHGLYITGNMDLLCGSSELWQNIKTLLINDGSLDTHLTLKCENHPHKQTRVMTGEDFLVKSPEGGCLQTCNKTLLKCGHACPRLCHLDDRNHLYYKCKVPCPKVLCKEDHACPNMCFEECPPCKVVLNKLSPCGHTNEMECCIDPKNFKCPIKVEKKLPHCQHIVTMPCYCDINTYQCPKACDTRLECGHQCRKKCHRTRDPDHLQYKCEQTCMKLNSGCSQNHKCQRLCSEECGNCLLKIKKMLPCGHEAKNVECFTPSEEILCKEKCKKTLPCKHPCKKLCYALCGNCLVKVKKTVPDCQHEIWIDCSVMPTSGNCDGKCPKKLPCGHPCQEKCKDVCTKKCKELVLTNRRCPKDHPIKMPCHLVDKVLDDAWEYCDAPCPSQLNCEHQCVGNCGRCFQGRLHVSCQKRCQKPLVCGHICNYPCSSDCPPCQEQCSWKCEHSRCRKKCGAMCSPCKEKCTRKCEHQACKKLCGEPCSNAPCQHPCPKKLECGHVCLGFCGEPCPPLCKTCKPEEVTEFMLIGFEEDNDAKFVFLEDCGHSIEVHGLEGWLAQENCEIGMKSCPRCRKPIYNNRRYQHIVLETYKDVQKVKANYYTDISKYKVKRRDIDLLLQ